MQQEQGPLETRLELDVGQEQEIAHRHPDLREDGVAGRAQERFDFEVLFDPFEKEFHMPAGLVDFGDGDGGQLEVVGEELVGVAGLGIEVADQAQGFGVFLLGEGAREFDGAIVKQAVFLRDFLLSGDAACEVLFGAGDEEGPSLVDPTEPVEVDVAPVDDIDAVRNQVQKGANRTDIGAFPIGQDREGRDLAAQVELAVELDRAFGLAELGPGEEFQAEIDRSRVEALNGMLESELMLGGDGLATIQQVVEELLRDAPVAAGIGVGQGRALHGRQPQVVELWLLGAQRGLDVPQADFAGRLGIQEGGQLVPGREFLDVGVATEAQDGLVEVMSGQQNQQLVHNRVRMHGRNPPSERMSCSSQSFYRTWGISHF